MMRRKRLFKWLEKHLVNPNDAKYLAGGKRKAYWMYFSDMQTDQTCYRITVRGNYIRAFTERYEYEDGKGINSYNDLFMPALITEGRRYKLLKLVKKEIVKVRFHNYLEFAELFVRMTPNLNWHEDSMIVTKAIEMTWKRAFGNTMRMNMS